jgi:Flp pilus assembly pilin Flp
MVEYALIILLVALVAITGWSLFGTAVSNLANNF